MGKMVKRLFTLRGRDFAKELAVQRALARQIDSEKKLRELQAKNKEKFKTLHPTSRSRILKGLSKLGIGAGKETVKGLRAFKKFRKRKRGSLGKALREGIDI